MKKDPWFRNRLIRDGIYRALHEEMTARSEIVILGEGSHMKIHFDSPAIEKDFPDRVLTMPISEDGNTNFAVGLALRGVVPVVDVISSDFLFRTMDSICNTAAKVNYVHDPPKTVIIRAEFLTGGPTTGQRIEEMFCHVPGLRVGVPSSPIGAYEMMAFALQHKGVTILFEDRMIEDATTPKGARLEEQLAGLPAFARTVGEGAWTHAKKASAKVAVASYGLLYRRCHTLFAEDPRVELVDLRWLAPLDGGWVEPGKPLLVVTPSMMTLTLPWLMARASQNGACTGRVVHKHGVFATIPASRELHDVLLPSDNELRREVDKLCAEVDFDDI